MCIIQVHMYMDMNYSQNYGRYYSRALKFLEIIELRIGNSPFVCVCYPDIPLHVSRANCCSNI